MDYIKRSISKCQKYKKETGNRKFKTVITCGWRDRGTRAHEKHRSAKALTVVCSLTWVVRTLGFAILFFKTTCVCPIQFFIFHVLHNRERKKEGCRDMINSFKC